VAQVVEILPPPGPGDEQESAAGSARAGSSGRHLLQ